MTLDIFTYYVVVLREPEAYGGIHVDHEPLPEAPGRQRVERAAELRHDVPVGVRGRRREAAQPLREGQAATVGRRGADRLVAEPRPGEPRGSPGRADPDLRLRRVEPADPRRAGP